MSLACRVSQRFLINIQIILTNTSCNIWLNFVHVNSDKAMLLSPWQHFIIYNTKCPSVSTLTVCTIWISSLCYLHNAQTYSDHSLIQILLSAERRHIFNLLTDKVTTVAGWHLHPIFVAVHHSKWNLLITDSGVFHWMLLLHFTIFLLCVNFGLYLA